jgi:hypothetical protein
MAWCARCDVLTSVSVGAPCPSCGVPTLDASPVSRDLRSPIQVLELEEAPVLQIAESVLEIADASAEPPTETSRRRAGSSRLRRHPRLIAITLAAALAGAV